MEKYTISKAKESVKIGIIGYLYKDHEGKYVKEEKDRLPFYLEGMPGVGKTQIVKEIAKELEIGFVSFSLTHHTRNTVLGLPVIDVILHMVLDDLNTYRQIRSRKLYSAYADLRVEHILYNMNVPRDKRNDDLLFDRLVPCIFGMWNASLIFMDVPESYYEIINDSIMKKKVMKTNCRVCDHSFWEKELNTVNVSELKKTDVGSEKDKWAEIRNAFLGPHDGNDIYRSVLSVIDERSEIAKQYNDHGEYSGFGKQSGRAIKNNKRSYMEILRSFMLCKESDREDPELIDRIMYSYGFDLYGDVALIEPQEEAERRSFDTIAIAVDTSGSCSGETVNMFLGELLTLIEEVRKEMVTGRIMIYQCDSEIQKKYIIENGYVPDPDIENMDFYGFGGTSFVPVFEDLEKYEKNEGRKVEALFYLTDGLGIYPVEKPDFRTYFMIDHMSLNETVFRNIAMPEWIDILEM